MSLIITTKGYFGLFLPRTQRGDLVCAFVGSLVPFILRERGKQDAASCVGANTGEYELLGSAYVHDILTNVCELNDEGVREFHIT